MKIREAAAVLGADIVQPVFEDTELSGAYTSDLLSDVIANAKDGGALITIQAHKNTVAVATLVDVTAIIICNSRPIPDDMIASAKEKGIAILVTKQNQFTVSGRLFDMLNN
jgi:predicted transcriptional regulator